MANRTLYAYADAIWEPIYTFNPTGHPEQFTLEPGKYLFMCYGAAGGGTSPTTSWGYGAAAYGVFETDTTETLYAVVGGNGEMYGETSYDPGAGGYNGGGNGGAGKAGNAGGGGGGATDIRLTLDEDTIQEPYPDYPPGFPTDWVCEETVYGKTYYLYKPIEYVLTHEYSFQSGDFVDIDKTDCTISFRRSSYLHPYARYEFDIMLPSYIYYDQFGKSRFVNIDDGQFKLYARLDDTNYPAIEMQVKIPGTELFETHTYYADIHEPLPVNQKFHTMIENHLVVFSDENGNEINRISFEDYIHGGFFAYINIEPDIGGRIYHAKTYYKDEPYIEVWPCIYYIKKEEEGPITGYDTGAVYAKCDDEKIYWGAGYADSYDDDRYYPHFTMDTTFNPVHAPVSKSLLSRILVAGGGGGASGSITNVPFKTSYGGGESAAPIQINSTNPIYYGATSLMPVNESTGYKFGRGMDAGIKLMIKQPGNAGAGGGGGGWFGGYSALIGYDGADSTSPPSNITGTGGSSYAYTSTSWTPYGYIPTSKYQLKNTTLVPCQSSQGKVIICKPVKALVNGDRIISPLTGQPTKIDIFPGVYRLKCWGGEGGAQNDRAVRVEGGYSEGLMTLTDNVDLYSVVGGSGMFYDLIQSDHDPLRWNRFAGYNGGATPFYQDGNMLKSYIPCGGGATDFRLSLDDTTLNPTDPDIRNDLPDYVYQLKGYNTQSSSNSNIGYFDTGYIMTPNTKITCEFEIISKFPGKTTYGALFGARNTSAFTATDAYGFFVYTNNVDKTTFYVGTELIEGSPITKDTRITLTANANSVTWTDGDITETLTSSAPAIDGLRTLYVGAMHYSTSSVQYRVSMKFYNFKIYENNVLVHDYVPAVDPTNATGKIFDNVTKTFITVPNTHANILFEDNPTRSALSRIIVAGGAGSHGGTTSTPGKGGGTTGGTVSGGNGNTSTGGTQTGVGYNASYPQITASFGSGGKGLVLLNNATTGCGGGGWFGGSGSYYASNDTRGKGGNGGSGYVLTEDSFKPEGYIPTEHCYMTEAVTTLGGNDLPPNVTKAEIEVIEATPVKMVIRDASGYKRFDQEYQAWVYFSDTINSEMIEEYGVYKIHNLIGINEEFDVVVNDPLDVALNAEVTYMPKRQEVTFLIPKRYMLSNVVYDIEYDQTKFVMDYAISKYDNEYNAYTLMIDKVSESDEFRLYMIQLFAN